MAEAEWEGDKAASPRDKEVDGGAGRSKFRHLKERASAAISFPGLKNKEAGLGIHGDAQPPASPVPALGSRSHPALSSSDGMELASSGADDLDDLEDREALLVPDRLKFESAVALEQSQQAEDDLSARDMVEKKAGEDDGDSKDKNELFEEFEEWLLECGAKFPDLYLKRYTGDVRGVHAKRRVGPYQCLVQIPLRCLITDYMGRTETAIGRKLFSSHASLSTPNLIAVIVYILTTREDPNHFFQPYYRILPKDYTNFPIFWDEEQLSWLTGSPLVEDIAERKRNMRADYDEVCRVCPEFSRFSFDEFLEVRTAVGSRNFGIVVHDNKRTAMVPYADMLNHYRPRETSWTFDDSKNAFTITSLSALQGNQQVMDSYGKKCNAKFLLHYGFAVEVNREEDGKCQNEVYLRLSLPPSEMDELHDLRLSILGPSRASRGFRLSMNIEDKATAEALGYCRVAVSNDEELRQIMVQCGISESSENGMREHMPRRSYRDSSFRDLAISFVNPRNEIAALEMLATACQKQLEHYTSTYEDNMALAQDPSITPFSVRRTALIVIMGEQEICHYWIYACDTISSILAEQQDSDRTPLHMALRSLPRSTHKEADLYRYATRIAYELRVSGGAK